MRVFRWFPIVVVAVAIGLMAHTACAQATNQAGTAAGGSTLSVSVNPAAVTPASPAAAPANPAAVAPPAQAAQGCSNCGCSSNAGNACNACNTCCEIPAWHAFGEYLMLRPRNDAVEYAVPINGPIAAGAVPLQIGPTAVVDPQFQSGFRVGFERILNQCSSVSLSYTYYRNEVNNGPVGANTPFVLRPMVFHPSSADAASDFQSASAREITSFNLVDLDYHHNLWSCDCSSINYLIGTRYAQLGQQFNADFQSIISAAANTNIEFDGIGLRLGLDGERSICNGFFFTVMANANFLGGQVGGSYQQSNTNNPIVAATNWQEARFVTILETGVSVGWQSCDGRIRTSVGYIVSDWMNVVKPSDYISAVQANHYVGPDQVGNTSLVFDGMTARVELSW